MKKGSLICLSMLFVLAGCTEDPSTPASASNQNSSNISSSEESSLDPHSYVSGTYANPVNVTNGGFDYKSEVADPSIVKGDDGYFYIFATGRVVLRSEDGCTFSVYSNSIIPVPSWGSELYDNTNGIEVWAPDVKKIGDKWIYYYSLSGWGKCVGIGYATADNIAGPYTDQGKLFTYKEIGVENAIDPCIYDDDGSIYMAFGSFQGLYLIQLTADGMGLYGGTDGTDLKAGVTYQAANKVMIAGKVGSWDGSTYEGSYIIKHDGYYYYFGSSGTCCEGKSSTYRVYCGRSENITGPYVDSKNRPLTGSGNGVTNGDNVIWAGTNSDKDVVAPGHNSVLQDDTGDLWLYYHAYSSADNFNTRHLFMDKLIFDEKTGFPHVEGYKPTFQEEKDGPSLLAD